VLSFKNGKFSNSLKTPLHLQDNFEYEIALVSLDLFYSIPNVTSANNKFRFSYDSGKTWNFVKITPGCYSLQTLYKEITRVMDYNLYQHYFTLDANTSTLKSVINITAKNFQIDFSHGSSFGSILGFNTILKDGYNESKDKIDLLVNRIFVKTNLAESSWYNDSTFPFVYSFFPNALPGDKLIEKPNSLIYHHLNNNSLHHIEVSLIDEKQNEIDLNDETVTIEFHIRSKI
jgi:hypothetical protein